MDDIEKDDDDVLYHLIRKQREILEPLDQLMREREVEISELEALAPAFPALIAFRENFEAWKRDVEIIRSHLLMLQGQCPHQMENDVCTLCGITQKDVGKAAIAFFEAFSEFLRNNPHVFEA